MDVKEYLYSTWIILCNRICARGLIDNEFKLLIKKYSEKTRYYHNLLHLLEMIEGWHEVKYFSNNPWAILQAIFYYDVEYDTDQNDNEEQSVRLFTQAGQRMALADEFIQQVKKLIIVTKEHKPLDEILDSKYLIDLDFLIFSKQYGRVFAYEKAIRLEYIKYSDEVYYPKRYKVLKQFIDRERLYYTDYFYENYEVLAQKNIKSLLAYLKERKKQTALLG